MTQRKTVQEFDQALLGPTSRGAAQPETDALTALARRISEAGPALPGIDEAFRVSLRERLVREASGRVTVPAARGRHAGRQSPARSGSRAGRGGGSGEQSSVWRRRLLAAGIGVAVATGSVGGIAIASAGALPGDPLYTTKKMFENLQLSMSGSATDQGRQYLKLADTRLTEIDDLLARPDVDDPGSGTAQYLAQTMDDLQSTIADGGRLLLGQVQTGDDQAAAGALSDFLQTERQRVLDLSWQLPDDLRGRPAQIVALMDSLAQQLESAQSRFPQSGGDGTGPTNAPGSTGPRHASPAAGTPRGAARSATAGASGTPTDGGTPEATAGSPSGASPSDPPTMGITLPLPFLPPSTSVDVPPLLPGLPGIDLGLGGAGNGIDGATTEPPQQ